MLEYANEMTRRM